MVRILGKRRSNAELKRECRLLKRFKKVESDLDLVCVSCEKPSFTILLSVLDQWRSQDFELGGAQLPEFFRYVLQSIKFCDSFTLYAEQFKELFLLSQGLVDR
jgi:hypothetical protein